MKEKKEKNEFEAKLPIVFLIIVLIHYIVLLL